MAYHKQHPLALKNVVKSHLPVIENSHTMSGFYFIQRMHN